MKLLIRNTELRDSEAIAQLSNQLGYKSEKGIIEKRLNNILSNKNNYVLVALENEKIVGWVHGFYSLRVESDPFIEIGGLVVNENYRKKGIGKILVDKIIKRPDFKECKKVRVRCNTVREESHIFYQKIGFKINKEQKVFDKLLR
ncbi:GNAT family N-acetyltransferase [Abyssalbus ytuae]|uniref:GNAT family N-acetyltransferase n=1 Tax=Abyssalbus ytuae TaxID=2926907 RepID=A0A9E6ZTA7_9FLAO|nr:GNAT family N-acetyltransferase [Abyssalbus ytuae]UOB16306.1 GNAT family N-acetyltransferase [Abyssalbus ytuae]